MLVGMRLLCGAAPVISARDSLINTAASQVSSSLSVVGLNFAFGDFTPSGRLGSAECSTMAWASSTSALCIGSVASPLVVTVGSTAGTVVFAVTFDGDRHAGQNNLSNVE